MIDDIGPLRGADESLNHQIVDTFAVVSESDYAWTEKIWTSIASVDGSVQVDFGLGKYHNRGIIDGFGGVSRGREQWTVRGSRELRSAPEDVSIGPLSYEIVEPLRQTRIRLEPNDVQPISFDLVLSGVTPPFFEDRNLARNAADRTHRRERHPLPPGWLGDGHDHGRRRDLRARRRRTRSGSVTTRGGSAKVSARRPATSSASGSPDARPNVKGIMKWSPSFFRRPDGSYYETAIFLSGAWAQTSAYVNDPDGTQVRVRSAEPRHGVRPAHALRAPWRAPPRDGDR